MKDVVGYIDSLCENCSGDHLELSDKTCHWACFKQWNFLTATNVHRNGTQRLILNILAGGAEMSFLTIDDADNEDGDTDLVETVAVTMAVNPLSTSVLGVVGTRVELNSGCSSYRNCWSHSGSQPMSASVSRAAGTRVQLSYSCSTCRNCWGHNGSQPNGSFSVKSCKNPSTTQLQLQYLWLTIVCFSSWQKYFKTEVKYFPFIYHGTKLQLYVALVIAFQP